MLTVRVEYPSNGATILFEGESVSTWAVVADDPGLPAALGESVFGPDFISRTQLVDAIRTDVPGFKWQSDDGKVGGLSWTRHIILVERGPENRDVLIVSDGPVYVMNSQGQTVDRILAISFGDG